MFYKLRTVAIAGSVALAGCSASQIAHKPIGSPDPGFGEVAKHNAAVQIIDPDPVYTAEGSKPGDHGAKATAAMRRYRTDAVKDVEQQTTSSGTTGSR